MGRHATHLVDVNSVQAWNALDRAKREALVLTTYRMAGTPLTDRQVAERLGFDDMNAVRPQCTRLRKAAKLVKRGSVIDPMTKARVRLMTIAEPAQLDLRDAL